MLIQDIIIGPKNYISVPKINLLINFIDARVLGLEI